MIYIFKAMFDDIWAAFTGEFDNWRGSVNTHFATRRFGRSFESGTGWDRHLARGHIIFRPVWPHSLWKRKSYREHFTFGYEK